MTCIYCRIDVKASQRTDGACPTCHRPFAFDPKRGDKLTDLAWSAAFERLSQGGTVKFTRRNLYYEIARRMQKRRRTELLILGGLSLGWTVAAVVSSPFFLIGTMATGLAAIKSTPRPTIRLGEADFEALLRRWTAAHGTPPGLIVRSDGSAPTPERPLPPDLAHYSFDRVVVTDRSETVDLLLANNFHFENNCAVLSVDGYPPRAFEPVRAMLRRNPKLHVYVLHDATVEGTQLAARLRSSPDWFEGCEQVVDVGLHPRQAKAFKGLWRVAPAGEIVPPGPDHGWLSRYTLELAAIRPEQIVKRLFRSLSTTAPVAAGGGTFVVDTVAFGSNARASDGGGDSFG